MIESTDLVLLVILCLGLIVPELFRKLKLPYISVLILLGAIFGPFGFDYIKTTPVVEYFGFLGAAFLMLMAGLEVKFDYFKSSGKQIAIMSLLNGLIPFAVGALLARWFGFSWFTSVVVGVIFISSSVAIIAGGLRSAGLFKNDVGKRILSSAVVEDVVSLFLLAIILQSVAPITRLPLPLYFLVLLASVFVFLKFLPRMARHLLKHLKMHTDDELDVRVILVVLIASMLYFSWLGVHPIVAAFIVGLLISRTTSSKREYAKIHTIAYGVFIPVFFFIVGMKMDLSLLVKFDYTNAVMLALIVGLLGSKFLSGYVAGRLVKFSKINSAMFGVASTAQLTTTLAVVFAAAQLNLLPDVLVTAVIILSIITSVLSPVLLNVLAGREASEPFTKGMAKGNHFKEV